MAGLARLRVMPRKTPLERINAGWDQLLAQASKTRTWFVAEVSTAEVVPLETTEVASVVVLVDGRQETWEVVVEEAEPIMVEMSERKRVYARLG